MVGVGYASAEMQSAYSKALTDRAELCTMTCWKGLGLTKKKIIFLNVFFGMVSDTWEIMWRVYWTAGCVCGIQSTPSLPSLQGPLWPGVVPPDRDLSMAQIEQFDI